MSAPHEVWLTPNQANKASRIVFGEDAPKIPYLRADLTCGECVNLADCPRGFSTSSPACTAISFKAQFKVQP